MRIETLACKCVGGEVGVDHYRSGACAKPPAPLPWLLGIQKSLASDTRHTGNAMTATRLCDCPRSTAIEDNLPIRAVNLMRHNSAMVSTAVHKFMEQTAPEGFLTEVRLDGTLFAGTDVEVEVGGTADVIRPRILLLEDYKMTSSANQRVRAKKGGHAEWGVQASVYNLLAPTELKAERAVFWSGALVAKREEVEAWLQIPVRLNMTEEEILAFKPFGGQATIHDHLRLRLRFLADLAAGVPVEEAVSALPLTGAEQDPWVCEYCTVSHVCANLVIKQGTKEGIA